MAPTFPTMEANIRTPTYKIESELDQTRPWFGFTCNGVDLQESQRSGTNILHLEQEVGFLQWWSVLEWTSIDSICNFWPRNQTQDLKHLDKPKNPNPDPRPWRSYSIHMHSNGWSPRCTEPVSRCGKHSGSLFASLYVQKIQKDEAVATAGWISEKGCSRSQHSSTAGPSAGWSRCLACTVRSERSFPSSVGHPSPSSLDPKILKATSIISLKRKSDNFPGQRLKTCLPNVFLSTCVETNSYIQNIDPITDIVQDQPCQHIVLLELIKTGPKSKGIWNRF